MSWWHRTGTENMGKVVALVDDLFFQMKLAETAKQLGLDVKVAANGDALMGLLESAPKLVIVDLNARSQPLQAATKSCHGQASRKTLPRSSAHLKIEKDTSERNANPKGNVRQAEVSGT